MSSGPKPGEPEWLKGESDPCDELSMMERLIRPMYGERQEHLSASARD